MSNKYIQSFYQYPVTFSSLNMTVPARNAQGPMRNVVEISEKDLEKLKNCEPLFRELVRNKKYRVLGKLPDSYVPASVQVNKANEEADRYKAENEALKARIAELERQSKGNDSERTETPEAPDGVEETESVDYSKMNYKDLQKAAKAKGIDSNQSKAALIEALTISE